MFNNNINKPAISFFATDISKNYFCRDGFFRGKKPVFTGHWQKLANPELGFAKTIAPTTLTVSEHKRKV